MKLLAVCDSPTVTTGFSRVATNLLRRFPLAPGQIDIWGIGFDGTGYQKSPWQIFPAGTPWYSGRALTNLCEHLRLGDYTHLWILQDLAPLSGSGLPAALRQLTKGRIRTTLYFPVDSEWIPADWTDILGSVDAAATYTTLGREVVSDALMRRSPDTHPAPVPPVVRVIPHGVDTSIYHPLAENRQALRERLWTFDKAPWVSDQDFLLLNLNVHQRRKDIVRSLEILSKLREAGVPAKLVTHCAETSDGGVSLMRVAEQLGIEFGMEWVHHGEMFKVPYRSQMPESELPKLYHAADLLLTTTLGEGWGLSITEALACGCPVALPLHTGCQEIYGRYLDLCDRDEQYDSFLPLLADDYAPVLDADHSLRRPRVNATAAADAIRAHWRSLMTRPRRPLPPRVREWMDWDRLAAEMWQLVQGSATRPQIQCPP